MQVEFSAEARFDLADLYYYISQDNAFRARTFVDELYDKGLDLADSALHFPLYEADLNVRRRPYKGYFIFYKIDSNLVTVLRVLNSKRDYSNLFKT